MLALSYLKARLFSHVQDHAWCFACAFESGKRKWSAKLDEVVTFLDDLPVLGEKVTPEFIDQGRNLAQGVSLKRASKWLEGLGRKRSNRIQCALYLTWMLSCARRKIVLTVDPKSIFTHGPLNIPHTHTGIEFLPELLDLQNLAGAEVDRKWWRTREIK